MQHSMQNCISAATLSLFKSGYQNRRRHCQPFSLIFLETGRTSKLKISLGNLVEQKVWNQSSVLNTLIHNTKGIFATTSSRLFFIFLINFQDENIQCRENLASTISSTQSVLGVCVLPTDQTARTPTPSLLTR